MTRRPIIATLLLIGLATPAFAASDQPAPRQGLHFVVEDTSHMCSVIDSRPGKELRIIGNKQGYPSRDAAEQALKGMAPCKTQG